MRGSWVRWRRAWLLSGLAWLLASDLVLAGQVHISASSSLKLESREHSPSLAFDGDLSTEWKEASAGNGGGEWIQIDLGKFLRIDSVTVFGGEFSSPEAFERNHHIRTAELEMTTPEGVKRFRLEGPDRFEPLTAQVNVMARQVKLTLGRAHAGSLYSDTAVAEIAFNLEQSSPDIVAALNAWKAGKEGQKALKQSELALEAARARVAAGDLRAFAELLDAARLGSEPMRRKVGQLVEPGFALAYLEPDPVAVEMAKTLQRPEAIPAIEQAAFIASSPTYQAYLKQLSDYLHACGELRRPLRTQLPLWGTTGVEPGALQSRGEPIALDVDQDGFVYVCDIGNNRVQKYDEVGRARELVGEGIGLSTRFLGEDVPYFMTGATPGTEAGQFVQPLEVAVVSSRGRDFVAVVDAARAITLLTPALKPARRWSVPATATIVPGVGISGPALVAHKDEVLCLWGKEVWVYDLEGRLLRHFEVEDGQIRCATILKGRLLIHFGGRNIRQYARDGFRYGTFAALDASDFREDIDLASGPDGSLYVLTDRRLLLRYDKRGNLITTTSLPGAMQPPFRLAIGEIDAYITAGDRIHRVPLP